MRLLTDDPEFSWAGTGFIVGLFAFVGLVLAAVHNLKERERSRWWKLLALPALVIGVGPGSLMLPGVLGMALVVSRRRLTRAAGVVVLAGHLVMLGVLFAKDDQPTTVRTIAGVAVMLGCCAVLGVAAHEALTGWPGKARTSAASGQAERHRGQGADDGRDRGSAEDPLDLDDRSVEQGLPVGLVGQGSDGGVVLVQADRGEQGEADDHADHPGDDDESARRAVRIIG